MTTPRSPLAIVGVSALFPGSDTAEGFWRDVLAGSDLLREVPPDYWLLEDYYDADPKARDKTYGRRGGFLDGIDFDALSWGIPPNLIEATDTAQLMALVVAQRVLEDATRGRLAHLDKERVGVILGVTSAQELLGDMVARLQRPVWQKSLREAGLPEDEVQDACDRIASHYVEWQEASFPGLLGNVVAGRIANRLDLHGTNCVTDAACASTFSALSMAANELWLGDADMVIAGGVDTMNGIFMHMCFSKTPALSPSGDCRPFSDAADGTMLGEGLAMFALRRLEDAERDGDPIYAVLKGVGTSSDGRSKSVYAPVSEGQARSIRRAYERAGFGPETVELVEAHGTGTKAGDAAEFGGLRMVFDETGRPDRQWCALGSVKSQIGHTKAAAGAAGLFKAVLALHQRVLPPTAKIDKPNPKLEIEQTPFYLNTQARPWVRASDHPRRAGVSSFGFGGSNFHLAVEEYTGSSTAPRRRAWSVELLRLAADTPQVLADRAEQLAERVSERGGFEFAAWQSATEEPQGSARLAVIARDGQEAAEVLRDLAARIRRNPSERLTLPNGSVYRPSSSEGKTAWIFPGQGSQYVGMGRELACFVPEALGVWDQARDLDLALPTPLDRVVFPPPAFDDEARQAQEEALTDTAYAQPALGVVSVGLVDVLRRLGMEPDAVAGHSYGELAACYAAGVFDHAGLLQASSARGRAMAAASEEPGAMVAVRARREELESLRSQAKLDAVVANHNHPTQVVLSGTLGQIEAAEAACASQGWQTRRLPVATGFHSPVVAPAAEGFGSALASVAFAKPQVPVIGGAKATPLPKTPKALRRAFADALTEPVQFVEQVEALYADGVRTFVEVGAGHVLTGLVGKTLEGRPHQAIALDRKGKDGLAQLLTALGTLWASGVSMALAPLWDGWRVPVDPATLTKPKLAVPIKGSNYGRPYPPPGGAAALPGPNPPRPEPEPRIVETIVEKIVEVPVSHSQDPSSPRPGAAPQEGMSGWLSAFQEIQRQTAEAHGAFQDAMTRSHEAYLSTVQQAFSGLTGQPVAAPPAVAYPSAPAPAPALAPAPARQPVVAPPSPAEAPAASATSWTPPAPAPQVRAAAPVASVPPTPVVAASSAPGPAAASPSAGGGTDVTALLLDVVADKTGYPSDMLSSEMSLEADLGVDSIKRVEILSELRERAPHLPEVDASAMASLETLGEIIDALGGVDGGGSPTPTPTATAAASPSAVGGMDVTALLLDVVADKTGYPSDMLSSEMSLEADLGVDSIKRVEILSELRERAPHLPEVDASAMASLETLGEIIDALGGVDGGAAPSAPAPTASAASAGGGTDVTALLLDVVADKTGYPSDMLSSEMSLEADLGVDSIKRVEILSELRERAPHLPEVDASAMASLETLGEIVEALGSAVPTPGQGENPVTARLYPSRSAHPASGRYALKTVQAAPAGLGVPGLASGVQVVASRDRARPIASALVSTLGDLGVQASVVSAWSVEGGAAIVSVDGLGLDEWSDVVAAREAQFALASAVARSPEAVSSLVFVQQGDGRFGPVEGEALWGAGAPGLARTAAAELPGIAVRAVDLRVNDAAAVALAWELVHGGTETVLGLDGAGGRWSRIAVEEWVEGQDLALCPQDVVVATGGARGVTALTIIELARATGASFALLGRTPLAEEPACAAGVSDEAGLKKALIADALGRGERPAPAAIGRQVRQILAAREVRETLEAIRSAGGRAAYIVGDVSQPEALRQGLDEVRQTFGEPTAVIHGAGVLADRHLKDKTLDDVRWVMGPKVDGLRTLLDALADAPLRAVLLFGSVAAWAGNPGQSDYAYANAVLNRVAETVGAARPDAVVRTLGWGPWDGGMVTPQLRRHFENLGVPLIPPDLGAQMLVDELRQTAGHAVVLGGDPSVGLGAEGPAPSVNACVRVHSEAWPALGDHRVDGAVVVPVAFALEWMARAASALRPEWTLWSAESVEVVKGVVVDDFDGQGELLTVVATQLDNGQDALVAAETRDRGGRVRHRARFRLGPQGQALRSTSALPGEGRAWSGGPIYDGSLIFHGPALQVLKEVRYASVAGGVARGLGAGDLSWAEVGGRWNTDPAVVDGILQLGLLWVEGALGAASLPTGIQSIRWADAGALVGPVEIRLRKRDVGSDKAVYDAEVLDAQGRLRVLVTGATHHRLVGRPTVRPRFAELG